MIVDSELPSWRPIHDLAYFIRVFARSVLGKRFGQVAVFLATEQILHRHVQRENGSKIPRGFVVRKAGRKNLAANALQVPGGSCLGADFTPYNLTPIVFDGTPNATWTALTQSLNFSKPDMNEVELRRAIQLSEGIPYRKPGK
jgi:hypothetical protein